MILLMTINPGEAGPGFHEELLTKIKNVRELIGDRDIDLEVDGGIDNTNIAKCKEAGVNVFCIRRICIQRRYCREDQNTERSIKIRRNNNESIKIL